MTSGRLALLGAVVAAAGLAAYVALFRIALVRNHPEGYVVAAAVGTGLALLALRRARRWSSWLALAFSGLALVLLAWFNFVATRVPDTPVAVRVGEAAPDFSLLDAAGRTVALADYRGRAAVVLVFYRGYW